MPRPDFQSNYAVYFGAGAIVAAIVLLPGWCVRRRFPDSYLGRLECLPLPGLMVLALAGLAAWRWRPGRLAAMVVAAAIAATLLILALIPQVRRRERSRPSQTNGAGRAENHCSEKSGRWVLLAYAALVVSTATASAIHRPVTQDFWAGTSMQSPLPASPPDSVIPYRTAAYLWDPAPHPRNRRQNDAYFWTEWSVRSRGPLVPLAILATFPVVLPQLQGGGDPGPGPWPAASDGYFVARWLTILLNASVVFGAFAVWRAWAADSDRKPMGRVEAAEASLARPHSSMYPGVRSVRFGLAWLMLAPAVWFNTAFGWPKLLATYFLLLAAASILEVDNRGSRARDLRTGALLASAYLSHPVGALYAPPLLVMQAWRHRSDARAFFRVALAGLIWAGPWLVVQFSGPSANPFFRYPAGDGRGLAHAATFQSWLRVRWNNLWYTLAPGAWFFSSRMAGWIDGPLSPAARWAVQAAKTLPAGIGFSTLVLPLRGCRRQGMLLLTGSLLLAVLCWGFSDDGLGRNCLEPLTIGVIVWTSSRLPATPVPAHWLLALLCLETISTLAAAYGGANGFSLGSVSASEGLLFLVAVSVLAGAAAAISGDSEAAQPNLNAAL